MELRLSDLVCALWFRQASDANYLSRVSWADQSLNFRRWEEDVLSFFSRLSQEEQKCVLWLIDQITFQTALAGESPEQSAPLGRFLPDEWGVNNAVGWAQAKFGGIRISSTNRGVYPHSGLAVDFIGETRPDWRRLARVFLYRYANGWNGGIAVGVYGADMHLHLDTAKKRSWIETSKARSGDVLYTGQTPYWKTLLERIRAQYFLKEVPTFTIEREESERTGVTSIMLPLALGAIGAAVGYDGKKNYAKPALYAAGGLATGYVVNVVVNMLVNAGRAIGESIPWRKDP